MGYDNGRAVWGTWVRELCGVLVYNDGRAVSGTTMAELCEVRRWQSCVGYRTMAELCGVQYDGRAVGSVV